MSEEKTNFEDRILSTIEKFKMLESGYKVLVAVSGGPDSVALLNALIDLRSQLDLEICVFHLNHMMRGESSVEDAKFVEKLAKKNKLDAAILSYNVPKYIKEHKFSPEDGARRIRYQLLEETAKKVRANKVALAHNLDDQVETFLMRLVKGAGREGLSAIPEKRDKFIRPLIETKRSEIENYCGENNLEFRLDESNNDLNILRNKVRHRLVPNLKSYNPNFEEAIVRIIDITKKEEKVVKRIADEKYKKM